MLNRVRFAKGVLVGEGAEQIKRLTEGGYEVQGLIAGSDASRAGRTMYWGVAILRKKDDLLDEVEIHIMDEDDRVTAETEHLQYVESIRIDSE